MCFIFYFPPNFFTPFHFFVIILSQGMLEILFILGKKLKVHILAAKWSVVAGLENISECICL